MKRLFTLLFILASLTSQAQWTTKASLPTAVAQHAAVAHPNGNIYIAGGYVIGNPPINLFQIYNTTTDIWSAGPAMPNNLRGAGFCLGSDNKVYIIGGFGPGITQLVHRFNPLTNLWDFAAPLLIHSFGGASAAHGNKIYHVGGVNAGGTPIANLQIYDVTTNTWTNGAPMPAAISQLKVVATPSGDLFVFAGGVNPAPFNTNVYKYNIAGNTWTTVATLPANIAYPGAALAPDGKIYIVGGKVNFGNHNNGLQALNTTWIFNPVTNTFSAGPNLPSHVGENGLVRTNDGIYSIGGTNLGQAVVHNYFLSIAGPLVNTAPAGPHCAGAAISIPYSTSGTTYNTGNIFNAELSDASGNFATPTVIGSVSATGDGTISATIPPATSAGSGYRIRVVATSPVVTGDDNGTDITINTAPQITCPANISVNSSAGMCGANVSFSASATGVPAPGITYSPASGSFFPVGTTLVTATATNSCGTDVCTFNVTVTDNEPPSITCKNATVFLNSSGTASIVPADVFQSGFDNCGPITLVSVTPNTFTCAFTFNSVVLTVSDIHGNTATCNATVTVLDNTPPTAICQNLTVQLDATGNATITAAQINNGSFDNCNIGSYAVSPATFTCSNVGTNTVTLTVTDGSGNTGTCTATVTVQDITPPVASCQNLTVQLNSSGTASVTAAQINNGSSDACGIQSLTVTPSNFTCSNIGANSVVLTVTDVNGNSSTCNATVTVQDIIPPVALCQNATVQLDAFGNASVTSAMIDNGSSDNCGITSIVVSPSSFTCLNTGNNTVTLTATDASGNSSTCTATVTVQDILPPNAICQNITIQLNALGVASITAAQINNGSTDNCGIASMTVSPSSFTCANIGSNTVTLTVTDVNGNISACTAVVTVEDIIPPVAVCQNITVQLNSAGSASISATQINNGSSDNCGITGMIVSPTSFTCANIGANIVTLTVTDASGNTGTCTATVTVQDIIAPVAVCQNITVQLNASGTVTVLASQVDNGSTDNCAIGSLSLSNNTFTCANIGPNVVTLTVTDVNGNSSTCTATITVQDVTPPSALCQNITVQLNASGMATILASQVDNGSSDACGIQSVSVSPSSFTCANVGANSVTLTVTDNNGNVSTCTATVTVQDITPPVAFCQNISVTLNGSGIASITAAQINNGSSDACGIQSMSVSPSTFNCANVGPNVVVLTVTDNNGNSATCSATVTVSDNIFPTALCQNITVQLNASGSITINASQINNGSSDNCGIASMNVTPSTFNCSNIGTNVVSFSVTDNSGNISNCAAIVTVQDVTPPVAQCQNIIVQLDATGNASVSASQINNASSDNCGIATMSVSPSTFTCGNIGSNTVTLTVTDNSGNSSTCTATVTVQDIIPPVAVCQNITVGIGASGIAAVTASQVNNGSSDNCGIASLSLSSTSFTCANIGPNTVTLTVTDVNGNVSNCNATVTVQDILPPVAACQNITVQLNASGNASITASQINNGSSDNCGIASMTVSPNSFTCANIGANTVTLTVTDFFGNVSTCTSTVTVQDITPPVALCQNITVQLNAAGNAIISASQIDNGSSDLCGIAGMTVSPSAFSCANIGPNTVVLTVTDNSGNTSTCTATVTVEDIIFPTALCQNISVSLNSSGTASITAAQVNNGSFDNCGIASVVVSPSSFTCLNIGTNSVTLTVTDVNGNTSTCTSTVTVNDVTPPVAVCQNITVQLNASGMAVITPAQIDNGSTDACGIQSMTVSPNTFTCANAGANTVTLTVTDNNGNVSTCSATVTVQETTLPTAICQNLTVQLDAGGNATITPAQIDNGSFDNCGIASMSLSQTTFNCTNMGANTVTLSVFDVSGNVSTCSATVTVQDVAPPTAICQNVTIQLNASGMGSVTVSQIDNGSTDNCGIASLTLSQDQFTCADVGANTVVLTVTDVNGNSSTCSAIVTVQDVIPPVASCQNVTLILDASGNASTTASAVNNGSSDDCGIAGILLSQTSFDCSHVGNNPVTFTVTDVNGNTATCNAVVTVVDNTDPVVICPAPISVANTALSCGSIVSYAVSVSDNCPNTSLVLTAGLPSGSLFPIGTTINSYLATDASGNTSTCSFAVTVTDNEAPVITNVPANFSACNPITWTPPTVTDNCPGVSVTSSHMPGTVFPAGTTTVTYTATDVYGLQSTASFNVTLYTASVKADNITSSRDFDNICVGENITLTVNGGFLGEAAQWKWYSGSCGGTLVGTGTNITVSPAVTTTYYARAEGLCNTTPCVQIQVKVSTGPPSGSIVFSYLPSFGAPGITDSIVVNPVPGATYYRWFTNNGQINGTLFNGQLGPHETGVPRVDVTFVLPQQNYQLRVLAGNACGRTNQSNSTVRGTVPSPTSLTGPTLVCPGQTHSYTVSAIPPISGGSTVSYNWELIPPSAGTISGTGLTRSVTFAAGFTTAQLCVNGISSFGFAGVPLCIVISSNAPAPGPITGQILPCEGSTNTYSVAPVQGAVSYNWTTTIPGATTSGTGTTGTINFPSNAFSGDICVTANSACGVSPPSCLAVTSGSPGIPGPISGPVIGICGASNVNYALATSDANSYNWILPPGVTITGSTNMNSVNLNFGAGFTSGIITVQAIYTCGTASSSLGISGFPTVPVVTPGTICAGLSELYFASSTGAVSYNWTVTGSDVDYCTNPPSCSQRYVEWSIGGGSLSVTATNACGTSGAFTLSTNCRISESGEMEMNVYPNPTSGMLTVEFSSYAGGQYDLTITDMSGRVVEMAELNARSGLNKYEFDLNDVVKGIYMLYVKDPNGKISVTKVAVE